MLTAIIVDNEKPAVDVLKRLLEKTAEVQVIGSYYNGLSAMDDLVLLKPDIAFLEIEMSEINGLQLAESMMSVYEDMDVIFVTAYDQYAMEAFRVNASGYLLKPISYIEIEKTVHRLMTKKCSLTKTTASKSRIYCFNHLTVYPPRSNQPLKWRTAKTEELFAFIVHNQDAGISKWKICEALWPNYEIDKIDSQLHTTLYSMKKNLTAASIEFSINFSNGCYRMMLPESFIDINEFNSLTISNYSITLENQALYESILALYKGNYLEDHGYPWALPKAEDFLHKYHGLASSLVRFYIDHSDFVRAESTLRQVLFLYPYDDKMNELLLQLYFVKNDRLSLITHYKLIEKLYCTELGITPTFYMRQLYENIGGV